MPKSVHLFRKYYITIDSTIYDISNNCFTDTKKMTILEKKKMGWHKRLFSPKQHSENVNYFFFHTDIDDEWSSPLDVEPPNRSKYEQNWAYSSDTDEDNRGPMARQSNMYRQDGQTFLQHPSVSTCNT